MRVFDVLCIPPSSATEWVTVKLPLVEAATVDYYDESSLYEKRLKYVPNVFGCGDWRVHGGKDRCLVNLGNLDPGQTASELINNPGPYFLYKCIKESKGCLRNEHFEKALDAEDTLGGRDVYGSVFIFKVKGSNGDGTEGYDPLHKDHLRDAFEKKISDNGILVWLETGTLGL